jgi:hypothetical protein
VVGDARGLDHADDLEPVEVDHRQVVGVAAHDVRSVLQVDRRVRAAVTADQAARRESNADQTDECALELIHELSPRKKAPAHGRIAIRRSSSSSTTPRAEQARTLCIICCMIRSGDQSSSSFLVCSTLMSWTLPLWNDTITLP